jgi:hypothetical protein
MSFIKKETKNIDNDDRKIDVFSRRLSLFFLILSLTLLIYTFYRAEITFEGAKSFTYFKYYLISITGVIFWGFVLKLRGHIQVQIVTVSAILIVGLYLIELGLILLNLGQTHSLKPSSSEYASQKGIDFDNRTKKEVINDFILDGIEAVPSIYGASFVGNSYDIIPLAGISNKTTVLGNESGKYAIYKSDRFGFNNPDNQWDSRSIEWLLLGDSFTHGSAVQPGEDIAGQIRSITSKNVINLGIGGNGPLLEYASLVEYGNIMKPKNVLWIYFSNDLSTDLVLEKTNPLLMKYMNDGFSQKLVQRQNEIDNKLNEYIKNYKEKEKVDEATAIKNNFLYKTRWIRLNSIRNILSFEDHHNVDDPLFSLILKKAKKEVEDWGGNFYFVYLPSYFRYSQEVISHDAFNKKLKVQELVKKNKIPFIDIHQEVFNDHPEPLSLFPFSLPGHYNADGYNQVAKAILKNIEKLSN